jgi:hypothetical protein
LKCHVTYVVLVTVTASAVKVVVPVTVVSSVFVKGTVSVIVSRVPSIETTVDVLTATEVTVTVGMLRNDEQNSGAGEISWHSVSLTLASPGISLWAKLATANERKSEVMEVRILIRGSDSGPIVDVCTCHW